MAIADRSHRMERVDAQLLRLLSECVLEEYDANNDLVTLTSVHTTPDLHEAEVMVTASARLTDHVQALNAQRRTLQRAIKPLLDFKTIPNLTFRADEKGEEIGRVEHLIDQLPPSSEDSA